MRSTTCTRSPSLRKPAPLRHDRSVAATPEAIAPPLAGAGANGLSRTTSPVTVKTFGLPSRQTRADRDGEGISYSVCDLNADRHARA